MELHGETVTKQSHLRTLRDQRKVWIRTSAEGGEPAGASEAKPWWGHLMCWESFDKTTEDVAFWTKFSDVKGTDQAKVCRGAKHPTLKAAILTRLRECLLTGDRLYGAVVESQRQFQQCEEAGAAAAENLCVCSKRSKKKALKAFEDIEDRFNSACVEREEVEGMLIME